MKAGEVIAVCTSPGKGERKKDVGSLKFAVMTKGADATAGEVLRSNIEAMRDWSQRS